MPVVFEYSFTVNPQYRLFTIFDPTCDEGTNFEAARRTLGHGFFAWGPNAVVARAIDTGTASVAVEVWDDPPGTPGGTPDEIAVSELALPGGRISSIQALQSAVHVGVELPTGAGTYIARIAAYNRGVSGGFAPQDAGPFPGRFEAYRLQLWKISDEPSARVGPSTPAPPLFAQNSRSLLQGHQEPLERQVTAVWCAAVNFIQFGQHT